MIDRISFSVFLIAFVIGTGPYSLAEVTGVPDMWESTVSMAYQGPGPVVLYNLPNGTGSAFTEARDPFGIVDATITLIIRDGNGDPIANFPAEDVWLYVESVCPCGLWGMTPDNNSDANGRMTWTNPLYAGGWSNGTTGVVISGSDLMSGDLTIWHNSPDINCNLVVNLIDIQLFAVDFYGGYTFRSDFHFDEVINLADITKLAQGVGAACP